MFLNMLFEKMEPVLERMLMAHIISAKLTVRNAMAIALTQWPAEPPKNIFSKLPTSRR